MPGTRKQRVKEKIIKTNGSASCVDDFSKKAKNSKTSDDVYPNTHTIDPVISTVYPSHRFMCLDTRTWRMYHKKCRQMLFKLRRVFKRLSKILSTNF